LRITTIQGSPRHGGNTATVLGWVEGRLRDQGHEVDRIDLASQEVGPCVSCYSCQGEKSLRRCVLPDDAPGLFDRMAASDAIVLAGPLYFWGVSAQLKALVDRSFSMVTGYGGPQHTSELGGRRLGMLVTCEDGNVEGNADLIAPFTHRLADYLRCTVAAEVIVTGCKSPDLLGDDARALATRFADDLTR